MKATMLIPGSGPIVILTSYASPTEPDLLRKLKAKGINKWRCHGNFETSKNVLNVTAHHAAATAAFH